SVFVRRGDLNRLLGQPDAAHEIAVYLKDANQVDPVVADLRTAYPETQVEGYWELSPDIRLYETQLGTSFTIFVIIFMLALIFGIINTMLMAVLERTRELGVLMSVGMNKFRVFAMIVLETLLLGVLSATVGMSLGWLSVQRLHAVGIDLSSFSQGLEQFGMSTIIRPTLDSGLYVQLALSVFITTVLASLYPAFKAIRLRPVEAVRKV
ncbi:MAG: FtsX-like permease family protein, partial [Bacteroidota bacterium]